MQIAISSLAFIGKSPEKIVEIAKKHNYCIEFSSGMPHRDDMETFFLNAPIKRYAHNYFPAPKIPFVLNLASSNKDIRTTSINHCIRGIQLSEKIGVEFFSAHAGFCVDPKPDELGRELGKIEHIDRKLHWEIFLESVNTVLEKTKLAGIDFLIENNVLAKMNVYADGTNPLLCVEAEEMNKLCLEINNKRLNLLFDTAHFKVSANTLNFDLDNEFKKIKNIKCIHHSDNEGVYDNNLIFDENYWFKKHIHNFKTILHVIEVKKVEPPAIEKMLDILEK